MDVSDSASAANSLLLDLKVDGVTKASIDKDGNLTANFTLTAIDDVPIGATTPSTGAFTTLTASTIDGAVIGGTTAAAGTFTTLTASSIDYPTSDGTVGQVLATDGSGTLSFADAGAGSLNTTATVEGSDGTSDWTQATGTDPWIATLTVSGILSTDRPIVDIDLSSVALADVEAAQTGWSLVYRAEASADDEVKLYATDEPAPNLIY
jgi:hypothetical protein